ncbi:hypothetical protein WMO66_12665, partial [Faecousia sp. CLA-AA-H192]
RRARPSHVCEPSGIFSDVHAAGENDSHFLCACERKLCEAFLPAESFGGKKSVKPSGFPFAFNSPPQRQNCKIMLQKLHFAILKAAW